MTRRSPSKKADTTGKKITSTAIATLALMPKPNHSTSSGARANTGIAWLVSTSGISQRCRRGEKIMHSASAAPSKTPSASPLTISDAVTSVCQAR